MQEHLQIQDLDKEVYWINATTRWDLQVLDDSDPGYIAPPVIVEDPYHVQPVYETTLLLSDLKARTEKVIHFGSIYGTGRVTALSEKHLQLEHYINGHLDIRNHHVLDATDLALKQLEEWRIVTGRAPNVPSFLGAHFRTGDGGFVRKVAENLQVLTEWVREMVKQGPTILPASTTAELPPPPTRRAATEQQNIPSFLDRCMGQPPESPLIFVATDIPSPRESPVLTAFLEEFPCTAFLSDLPASIAILDVRNPVDNVKMMSYLIALMDANVAAHGREFHGTPQSTVTYYIKDHLWPQYHPERHVLVN
ncbi:hypothetical protein BGZ98_001019 [Dissophora globulifera]|nr:hypothetical protein BGZ98_001019 [Dissophora globulifera]